MIHLRILVVALLAFSASPSSPSTPADDKPANQCAANPFSYDHGPTGQASWCGTCNNGALRQAPINIAGTQESTQPGITFLNYNAPTNLVIYPNLPNLKVDYKSSQNPLAMISVGTDRFKLLEFHFHRPSEEAIDNRRFPMVLHLVHLKDQTGCDVGVPGCVAVISVLINEGTPAQNTTALLNILFSHFPPPTGDQGVQFSPQGLLPAGYENAGYWRYDGSLTTPPCTENITFYVLKPMLLLSADQLAEFERRYPMPNARDVQPLNGRQIINKR